MADVGNHGQFEIGDEESLFAEWPKHAADLTEDSGWRSSLGFEDLRISDKPDRCRKMWVSEAGLGTADFRDLRAIDVAAEDLEGKLAKAAHQAGTAGEKDSRADGFHGSDRQALADEFKCFFESLADYFVENAAADFHLGESAVIGEFGNPNGADGIG
jgi:hypothetical protein